MQFFVFYIGRKLPSILLMILSVPFLILPSAPTITGTGSFKMPHFSISISWSLYLSYYILWLRCYYPLELLYQLEGMFYICSHHCSLLSVFHTSVSSLLDSSQYSGQCQQCCCSCSLYSSSYFQVFLALCTNP